MADFKTFMNTIEKIANELNVDDKFINDDFILKFKNQVQHTNENVNDILNENRELKIGIVGQVKAGKSSFLNALIFDGQDILPKAATPMTAALTKITYSKHPYAKVVFYNKKDWEIVITSASNYDKEYTRLYSKLIKDKQNTFEKTFSKFKGRIGNSNPPQPTITPQEKASLKEQIIEQYTACKELTNMVKNNDVDVYSLLGKENNISLNNLEEDLQSYVGADGKYTPIVKYIELGLNNSFVEGIEIIDTPGMGDPIYSRSQKTKDFLMQCDLVFLLSYTGQFLNKEDLNFMAKTLPGESIHHAVLIGSKFDSVLLDYNERKPLLKKAIQLTAQKLNRAAEKSISEALSNNSTEYQVNLALKRLKESLPPKYISSLLYNIAKKMDKNIALNSEEEHILNQSQRRFIGFEKNKDLLLELANIDNIKKTQFILIKNKKQQIIDERINSFIQTQRLSFMDKINDIRSEAVNNLNTLKVEDIDKLQGKLTKLQSTLESMRRKIKYAFDKCAIDTQKYIKSMTSDIKIDIKNHENIKTNEEHKNIPRLYETGYLFWKKVHCYNEHECIYTASVDDVISNIRSYIDGTERIIINELDKAINVRDVQEKIKNIVLDAFNQADADFDEEDILGPIELVLDKLTIPNITIHKEKYYNIISDEFSAAYAKNEEIHKLKLAQTNVLQKVSDDICQELEKTNKAIEQKLNEEALTFVDDVKKQIEQKMYILKNKLEDRQNNIKHYNDFITKLDDYKNNLRKLGEN